MPPSFSPPAAPREQECCPAFAEEALARHCGRQLLMNRGPRTPARARGLAAAYIQATSHVLHCGARNHITANGNPGYYKDWPEEYSYRQPVASLLQRAVSPSLRGSFPLRQMTEPAGKPVSPGQINLLEDRHETHPHLVFDSMCVLRARSMGSTTCNQPSQQLERVP